MKRTYRALLGLYPYDFRAEFGAEMWAVFETVDARRRGAELAGLVAGAAAEWAAKLTSDRWARARTLPDLRMMRPAGLPRELWFRRAGCW